MSIPGMATRFLVSLYVLVFIAYQAPVVFGIMVLLAMLTFQACRAFQMVQQVAGRDLRPALRRLALETAAGVAANGIVVGGSMWAGLAYG